MVFFAGDDEPVLSVAPTYLTSYSGSVDGIALGAEYIESMRNEERLGLGEPDQAACNHS